MSVAIEVSQVSRTTFLWQQYDAAVKSELFSTALLLPTATYLIDPIPLAPAALEQVLRSRPVNGIIVTNSNHIRAAREFAARHSAPLFAHADLVGTGELMDAAELSSSGVIGATIIDLPGAPSGEIAVHHSEDGGELVIGDALINFDPYGFTFLPDKYCVDPKQMRRSLRALVDLPFERILFAHGTPIVSRGRERLAQLLASNA